MRPEHKSLSGGEFYGQTTAASDYSGTRGSAAVPIRPPLGDVSKGKFEGQSQYVTNFQGTIQAPVQSMKPKTEFTSGGAFDPTTTNRSQYQPWAQKPAELIVPVNARETGLENRDFQTEAARKYNDKGLAVRKSLKPEVQTQQSSARFEGESTATASFQGMQTRPADPFLPENSRYNVQETRDFVTEATKQFAEKAYIAPARSMKPPREELNSGSFNGETTNATSFRPYDGAIPAKPIRNGSSDMSQGNMPFQSETSYGKQYTGQVQPVVRSMKPASEPTSTGVFDASTTNRNAFQPYKVERTAQPIRQADNGLGQAATGPRDFQTEASIAFNEKGVVVRRSMKPEQQSITSAPFQGQSVAAASFTGKQCAPRESFKPPANFAAAPDDRRFVPESKKFGQAGYQQPRSVMRPEHKSLSGGEFYGQTTAASDYSGTRGSAAVPIRPPLGDVSKGKFEGQSQYVTNFQGTIQAPVQSMKPKTEFTSGGAFDPTTTNRSQYQPWAQKPAELIVPVNARETGLENRDFQTEAARKYNDKGLAVRKSLKPEVQTQQSSARFEGESTATASFQGMQTRPADPFLPENSRYNVQETRDFVTEATKQFAEKAYIAPARSMKPPREELNSGSFNGETTNATSFRPYDGAIPAKPIRNGSSDMSQGNMPFQSETSYGKQYTGQVQPVVRSMKPASEPTSTGVFDASTTNRTSFQPWEAKPAEMVYPKKQGNWYKNANEKNFMTEQAQSYNDKGMVVRRSMKPVYSSRQW